MFKQLNFSQESTNFRNSMRDLFVNRTPVESQSIIPVYVEIGQQRYGRSFAKIPRFAGQSRSLDISTVAEGMNLW
jgi:hypothetical protein